MKEKSKSISTIKNSKHFFRAIFIYQVLRCLYGLSSNQHDHIDYISSKICKNLKILTELRPHLMITTLMYTLFSYLSISCIRLRTLGK